MLSRQDLQTPVEHDFWVFQNIVGPEGLDDLLPAKEGSRGMGVRVGLEV
jgi:hypothetical protein